MRVESGRPGLSLLTSLLVSVDVKSIEPCFGIGHLSLICQLTSEDIHRLSDSTAAKPPARPSESESAVADFGQ